ncbi:hypothetical protein Q5752_002785 [Cryptotrichosporon argae]
MPLLFPNFRINQVFGANTDVGKTLLTTALVRASAARLARDRNGKKVFYLKPVSTGPDDESDVAFIERHTARYSDVIESKNLYQYREPMSPHLAARLAPDLPFPKTNDHLVRGVEAYARSCVDQLGDEAGCLYVETAGGVHSPALHPPHTQSTSLRPLLLPAILVASPHLGGISTTISAYESLLLRGYTVSTVLCLHHPYYRNDDFLTPYFVERGIGFWDVRAPPEKRGTADEDKARLGEWYDYVERAGREEAGGGVKDAEAWIESKHTERVDEINSMPRRTLDQAWWPFTQHALVNKEEDVMVIDSAHGDNFDAFYASPSASAGKSMLGPYFDGSASWFTQSHGHASEPLTLAAAAAAGRYGHVLYPSGTHAPALQLTEKLLATVGKGWADRVFYSDNGSTGVEVALKMALRASGRRYGWDGESGDGVGVIGLRGGYHGDTIGAMDATPASTFNNAVDWYKGRGHWFSPPAVQFRDGKATVSASLPLDLSLPSSIPYTSASAGTWEVSFSSYAEIYDLPSRLHSPLADVYRAHMRSTLTTLAADGRRFGALVVEPTCLGAGGMVFVDPLFQACLIEVVRASSDLFSGAPDDAAYAAALSDQTQAGPDGRDAWSGLPVIYDEVFSGLHRFGYHSASDVLHHTPDISVYAKILTGGLLPLSATLASRAVFDAFLSDRKVDALLHGHSYTANPVGCAVALAAIEESEKRERAGAWDADKRHWGIGPASAASSAARSDVSGAGRWSFWTQAFVERVSRVAGVKGAMAMGTVFAVELEDNAGADYSSHAGLAFLNRLRARELGPAVAASDAGAGAGVKTDAGFAPFRIHSRPLGNVCYIMTSLFTQPAVVRAMEAAVLDELAALGRA